MNSSAGPARMLARQLGKVYSRVPDPLDRVLLNAYWRMREKIPYPITIERVSGYDIFENQPISILIAGRSPTTEYFLRRLIGENYSRELLGRPGRHNAALQLCKQMERHDLTIIQGPRSWTDTAFDAGYWRVPTTIGSEVNLQFAVGEEPWVNNNNRKNLMRINQNGFVPEITHDESDFDYFYHQMYIPHIAKRFGALGQARSKHRMLRYLRKGALIWASRESQRLAATLVSCDGHQATSWIAAPHPQRPGGVKSGSLGATYLFALDWAIEQDMHRFQLGSSRACLLDGVLRHKKNWGASLTEDSEAREDLLFRWKRMTPAIYHFLHESPLVIRQGRQFSALTTIGPAAKGDMKRIETHLNSIAVAGLSNLIVIGADKRGSEVQKVKGIPVRWEWISNP